MERFGAGLALAGAPAPANRAIPMTALTAIKAAAKTIVPDPVLCAAPRPWRTAVRVALRNLTDHDPILVYQMGKVGSTTLYATLRHAELPNPVFHVHYLVPGNIRKSRERYRRGDMLHSEKAAHLAVGLGLALRVRLSRNVRWIVLTGVRDPIHRAISRTFQVATWRHPTVCRNGRVDADRMLAYLERAIRPEGRLIRDTYTWMDRELKRTLGIDLYRHPFDRAAGYRILRSGNVKMLVYRLENLDRVLEEGLVRLLALDDALDAQPANRAPDKAYGREYERVVEAFRLPAAQCRRIYDHPFMDHFYGPTMIRRFVRRWTR
mgnify:CR=1 FL=1